MSDEGEQWLLDGLDTEHEAKMSLRDAQRALGAPEPDRRPWATPLWRHRKLQQCRTDWGREKLRRLMSASLKGIVRVPAEVEEGIANVIDADHQRAV